MTFTLRTSCLWTDFSPETSLKEIAVSETLKKFPDRAFKAVSVTWILCPGCSALKLAQSAGLDWANDAHGSPRAQTRNKSFRIAMLPSAAWLVRIGLEDGGAKLTTVSSLFTRKLK